MRKEEHMDDKFNEVLIDTLKVLTDCLNDTRQELVKTRQEYGALMDMAVKMQQEIKELKDEPKSV